MEWPQLTLIGIFLIDGFVIAAKHGQDRGEYNIYIQLISTGIFVFLLHMGGFWT
jgi:hypothetical protein